MTHLIGKSFHRDHVFVAGGQPTVTYVERKNQHVELNLARVVATPNQIVSLAGPSKTGKTVLCRKILSEREYVWIDGGQISTATEFWNRVIAELNIPEQVMESNSTQAQVGFQGELPLLLTANGSRLQGGTISMQRKVHSLADANRVLLKDNILLVIDDFHYLEPLVRTEIMRQVKGSVFAGLKVILLSVTHRAFDAITAEHELTGRFSAVTLPNWSEEDLRRIPIQGFNALNVKNTTHLIDKLSVEAQENPFLMQQFCWEICFDLKIESTARLISHEIPKNYDVKALFTRLSADAGLPIYQKLSAGPQSRKVRAKRPLKDGQKADIYQAVLFALAETGPKSVVTYEELRSALSALLSDMVPQKHEITSALKHLSTISRKTGSDSAIDWDDSKREINIADPYLRFFLRWQVRRIRNGSST